MDLLRQKVESDLHSLRKTLEILNDSVSNLSVSLLEHKEHTITELAHLQTSLNSTQSSLANQTGQLNNKLDSHTNHSSQLNNKLDSLSSKLDTLNTSLSQHQQKTTVELAHLQTFLNSTQSSLANQTGQLNNKLDSHTNHSSQLNNKLDSLFSKLDTLNTSLSQHQQKTTAELAHLQTSFNSTQSSHNTQLNKKLDDLSTELCSKLNTLNSIQSSNAMQLDNKMDDMSSKANVLDSIITEHQQKTTAELAHLQASVNSTNCKLDSLTATAAQHSSDHQEIQANISDVQCMDTQQNLQVNLTHQLETIKDCIESQPVYSCGGTGGWRRAVYLDMTDPHTTCPSGWNMTGYSKRTCGRNSTAVRTCSSATFPVSGGEYNRICGRMKAYQWGVTSAFYNYHNRVVTTIDGAYASGVSVTHGTPRNHIWTFVAGRSEGNPTWPLVCPCDSTRTIRIPPFVGNDYFCESGINEPWDYNRHRTLHSSDTLWDGEDCLPSSTCCTQHNPPFFTKQLQTPTTDDIEARICLYYQLLTENLAVELVELYVQ